MNPAAAFTQSLPSRARLAALAGKVAHFGVWQVSAQALQLIVGFLLVRWLSVESYAQFGLALGFQNMLIQLTDLGFSSAILALVGVRIHDRAVVGRYVQAAWGMRTRMAMFVAPPAALAFAYFAYSHHWPLATSILLFASIIAALVLQGLTSAYAPVLLMHSQIQNLYRPQVGLNFGKLAVAWLLHLSAALGAVAISWVNVLTQLATGHLYRTSARRFLTFPETADPDTGREMRKYLAPLVPGMIFYAFQGQIQLFLISFFGKTQGIAEVAALGRIGQLFIFANAFTGWVLTPYIARVPDHRLAARYIQFLLLCVGFGAALTLSAFIAPWAYLWILGPKYQHVGPSLGMCLTASSLGYISATLYSFNNARKWVYHWTGIANIVGSLAIQVGLLATIRMDTTLNVMLFGAATAGFPIIPFIVTAIIGYRRSRAADSPPVP